MHNPCSYLLLKKLKNRALGMLSRGLSIKQVTEQRETKSCEKERRLPGRQPLTFSFPHSFNKFLNTFFVADIVLGTRDDIMNKTMLLLLPNIYSCKGDWL